MDLRTRFAALWERLEAKGSPNKVFDDLLRRYTEPHRRYHNEDHWKFGLSQFDLLADLAERSDWVELAYAFHDSVYEIGANDNEEQSTRLAISVMRKARLSGGLQLHVGAFIMTTKPGQKPTTPDQTIMVDIDRAILGQPRPGFIDYERKVREEYAQVPEEVFWRARKGILEGFMLEESIFFTSRFRDLYEEQARANLTWTISQH